MDKVRRIIWFSFYGIFMVFSTVLVAQDVEPSEIKKIWDRGGHNAFPDIAYFKDKLYVVFREGDGHIPNKDNTGNGKIRILSSLDGDFWETAAGQRYL